ncbi:serine hydrolase domain-containing protein [Nocardia transvalensis]|uniref:serine hydrolase domain-containing protein n=1 Tax=Nocardia transvalensis TaxID=37333 RepID=UPI001892D49A|nr:serine hydrolase domain-containing protein [Nocardia transvalensis]MBF6330117.1 beta-lactamase family protein [Nocardia transvalensis]
MSNVAFSSDRADLPADVDGYAAPGFEPLVRAFARLVGNRPGAGGALSVHRHGEPLVEIWTGQSSPTQPWTRETGSIVFSATKGVAATVVHRLADRGLVDYDAPVADYWPDFGVNGKETITVRQLLTHRAGLSALPPIAAGLEEVLDHELMEQRLAAAKPDRLLGRPTYHALTFGWLLAGLARAVTGRGMGELIRTEVCEPLGIDGIHLGRPAAGASTTVATLAGSRLALAGSAAGALFLGRAYGIPGAAGAATRALFLPGLEALLEGDEPPILDTELAAGNGVCTADGLARMYGALACGGMVNGRPYLSARTIKALRRVECYQLDHALFYVPMMWHLGYHSLPVPGARAGFGHIGLGGSFGWAEPRLGLSVGYVHNRLTLNKFAWDQLASAWVLPLVVRSSRAARRSAPIARPRAA